MVPTANTQESVAELAAPIRSPHETEKRSEPTSGVALCLSGGGYRAMMFHVGALWRLNEAGVLGRLDFVSSVSGGSITAGVLGHRWEKLAISRDAPVATLENFEAELVRPLRRLADKTIDIPSVVKGLLFSGGVSRFVERAYDRHLFHGAKLQDLPGQEGQPRFIINATNVMTGALWRFGRTYMADWRVGKVEKPDCLLATAVAASSAFPPFLSPLLLKLPAGAVQIQDGCDLHRPPYTERALLSDGGVYDNLGLETVYKRCRTLLVSDAGQKVRQEERPHWNWILHALRVINLTDDQVRSQRKRNLMAAYLRSGPDGRLGAYWSIRPTFQDLTIGAPLEDPLGIADFNPTQIASEPTRLGRMPARQQERLINWGYAVSDAALRRWAGDALVAIGIHLNRPRALPYPATGLRA